MTNQQQKDLDTMLYPTCRLHQKMLEDLNTKLDKVLTHLCGDDEFMQDGIIQKQDKQDRRISNLEAVSTAGLTVGKAAKIVGLFIGSLIGLAAAILAIVEAVKHLLSK